MIFWLRGLSQDMDFPKSMFFKLNESKTLSWETQSPNQESVSKNPGAFRCFVACSKA